MEIQDGPEARTSSPALPEAVPGSQRSRHWRRRRPLPRIHGGQAGARRPGRRWEEGRHGRTYGLQEPVQQVRGLPQSGCWGATAPRDGLRLPPQAQT